MNRIIFESDSERPYLKHLRMVLPLQQALFSQEGKIADEKEEDLEPENWNWELRQKLAQAEGITPNDFIHQNAPNRELIHCGLALRFKVKSRFRREYLCNHHSDCCYKCYQKFERKYQNKIF